MLSLCVHPEKKKKCFQKAIDELQENMWCGIFNQLQTKNDELQ